MVILTNPAGNEIKKMDFKKIDIDLNDQMDFELRLPAPYYTDDIQPKGRLFIPNTEYGGMIGGIKTQTSTDEIIVTGRSWRGILAKKVIVPPTGQDYKTVSGDIGTILGNLINECELADFFIVPDSSVGVSVTNYQFDRYVTLITGIEKMLKSVGYKIKINYVQQEQGAAGYLELSAVPIEDLSQQIELSQDSRLNFTFSETKNGVNHLICLGKGELSDRVVVNLYVQSDGTIGTNQYYFGIDEVTEVYENTSAETAQELTEQGTEKLTELTNKQDFTMDIGQLSVAADIGDIVGGRDYITGMAMTKPIINKIYAEENGTVSITYNVEGNTK